jgi:DnaJ like chaperone protein
MIHFASFFILSNNNIGFGGLFFMLAATSAIIYLSIKHENKEIKSPFAFNLYTKLSEDTLLYVYVCLSAQMIKNDLRDAREKIAYMSKYFKTHFPNEHKGFSEILCEAYREDIDYHGLVAWLKAKLPAHKDRVQIIYFLVGMGFIDGAINEKELHLLNNLAVQLGLTPKEFESMLGMHQTYEEKSQKAKQKTAVPYVSKLKLATQILGVSEHASMDEIKKAYRSLVKLHHPDRFFNESEAQQEIAQERFMHVQKAYEILEILKKTN